MNRGRMKSVSERSVRTSSNATVEASKVNDFRRQSAALEEQGDVPPVLSHDKRGWSYFVQRNAVLRTYQKRLINNNDIKVAALEFAVMFLSIAQLQWSYYSPYWREKRACAHRPGCVDTLTDGSFAVANFIRVIIAVLELVRLFLRFSQLWKTNGNKRPTIRSKVNYLLQYGLELAYTVFFPYPGLETFYPQERGDTFVLLSISVVFRTTSWGQWLYYPYPIRQKEKVASFSGNLEFSYRQFVIKKVLDDTPLSKILTFYTVLGATVAYLLHVMETIKGHCWWENDDAEIVKSEDAICYELEIADSLWMIFMAFLSIGYRDVSPRTGRGRAILAITACVAVMLDAMLFSIIIKKFTFSTMEARVHAFLYRMELHNKKDISAVMAVQSTFRYNKLYKHSLIWHQERGSNIFYRPLSDRLPNEVKKKLYASRFQKSLKQIMKYNTDGDPLNAFSKHVEVITAALGATFVDMTRLKKMYYRRVRVLEQRRQLTNVRRASSFCIASNGRPTTGKTNPKTKSGPLSDDPIPNTTDSRGVSAAWGAEMQRKCEATMLLLKRIEANAKDVQSW
ncbi:hypothetical protein V7S43_000931 [Phytophthora oleae]|uniref:Potassium channel domain-containing protein n=1 Tax=Phytophthora oleae TaxID=2107226 RepID=A0ABD3G2J6_9STRA